MEYFDFDGAMVEDILSEDAGPVNDFIVGHEKRSTFCVSKQGNSHEFTPTADHHIRRSFDGALDERPVECEKAGAKASIFNVPSVACNSCWLRELQCLIIRGAEDGCSSCKALSQPCSLATNIDSGMFMDMGHPTSTRSIASQSSRGRRKGSRRAKGRSSPIPCRPAFNGRLQTVKDIDATDKSMQGMSPMERWRHSPPETEPAPLSAISNAFFSSSPLPIPLGNPPSFVDQDFGDCHRSSSSLASGFSVFRAYSVVDKRGGSTDSDISQNSIHSSLSSYSTKSLAKLEKRYSRRRRSKPGPFPDKAPDADRPSGHRRFECTFYPASFRTRFDWSRHENTQHLSLESWICSRFGTTTSQKPEQQPPPPPLQQSSSSSSMLYSLWTAKSTNPLQRICVYCLAPSPSGVHFQDLHSIDRVRSSCVDDDIQSRTFYRKDHLIQHLRLVHSCTFQADTMADWRVEVSDVVSRCGFCAVAFDNWNVRREHLGRHFRAGARMRDWKGGWGLESSVERRLENVLMPTAEIARAQKENGVGRLSLA